MKERYERRDPYGTWGFFLLNAAAIFLLWKFGSPQIRRPLEQIRDAVRQAVAQLLHRKLEDPSGPPRLRLMSNASAYSPGEEIILTLRFHYPGRESLRLYKDMSRSLLLSVTQEIPEGAAPPVSSNRGFSQRADGTAVVFRSLPVGFIDPGGQPENFYVYSSMDILCTLRGRAEQDEQGLRISLEGFEPFYIVPGPLTIQTRGVPAQTNTPHADENWSNPVTITIKASALAPQGS